MEGSMLSPGELTVVGSVIAGLFGVIHAIQNSRLNKVENEKVNKETCIVGHTGLNEKVDRIENMVDYLHKDRINWKKQNGHSHEEGG